MVWWSVPYCDFDAFGRHLGQVADLFFSDHIRGHKVDHIAQWPQQRLPGKSVLVYPDTTALLPGKGLSGRLVLDHFHRQSHAVLTDIANVGMVCKVGDGVPHAGAQALVVFDNVVVAEDVQGGQCHRAADWVAGVAVAVQERLRVS